MTTVTPAIQTSATASLPRLLAITDLGAAPAERWRARLASLAERIRPGGLAVVLREHQLAAKARLSFGRELRALTRGFQQELWVADRLDLALLLDADGLHLGEGSVRPGVVRPLWQGRVTRAWHALNVTPELELDGVDGLLLSPVLAPRKGRAALGTGALARLQEQLGARHPTPAVYALGGVTALTAAACLDAGAWGAAAIGAVLSDEPDALARAFGIAR